MATNLTFRVNKGDPDISYGETGADYIDVDLINDYLIWTAGSDDVKAGEAEPSQDELNQASTIITDADVKVAHCLLFDYDGDGGNGILEEVEGMGENKRYVFAFSFDGATATEPQLEAWDDSNHNSVDKNVLGVETGEDSFVKAVCTTLGDPGAGWEGTAVASIAGTDVLLLNNGNGALNAPATGETTELYANLAIVIPANYDTPAVETFVLTVRYTYL